jgi:hypothetical protein
VAELPSSSLTAAAVRERTGTKAAADVLSVDGKSLLSGTVYMGRWVCGVRNCCTSSAAVSDTKQRAGLLVACQAVLAQCCVEQGDLHVQLLGQNADAMRRLLVVVMLVAAGFSEHKMLLDEVGLGSYWSRSPASAAPCPQSSQLTSLIASSRGLQRCASTHCNGCWSLLALAVTQNNALIALLSGLQLVLDQQPAPFRWFPLR